MIVALVRVQLATCESPTRLLITLVLPKSVCQPAPLAPLGTGCTQPKRMMVEGILDDSREAVKRGEEAEIVGDGGIKHLWEQFQWCLSQMNKMTGTPCNMKAVEEVGPCNPSGSEYIISTPIKVRPQGGPKKLAG